MDDRKRLVLDTLVLVVGLVGAWVIASLVAGLGR